MGPMGFFSGAGGVPGEQWLPQPRAGGEGAARPGPLASTARPLQVGESKWTFAEDALDLDAERIEDVSSWLQGRCRILNTLGPRVVRNGALVL